MSGKPRDPKFYVVGGPVQSARDCYLQRAADAELFHRLSEFEYCAVLAHRQTGKTSLAAATAWKLRSAGNQVAVVDLTQTSEEDPSENAGRWYYSIAYRIVRDLRIRFDIQAWWAERGGLTNLQRLREFFQEVVLEETREPVVVFFDRIEATIGEPLAQDLFSAIRACYDARATDTDFQRLTFAMFGSGAANDLVKKVQGSPFEIAVSIPLPDFSAQELAGLLAGLGEPLDEAELLARRVWSWTRGQPYLSQKVFRGLARRKEDKLNAESVDELVQSQFVGPQTINEEPHLSAIAELLLREGNNRSARLNLYGRVRKGVDVMLDSASVVQRELLTTGLISIGPTDQLRVRNEIYAMVFGTRWVNNNLPFGIKSIAVAAAVVAAVLAAPIWYNEYLPRPYVRALSAANQDYQVAEDAYESLSFLPGYGGTADRLFQDYLMRMGRQATTLPEITRANNQLKLLPQGEGLADQMLADFWERRATLAAHNGDRDGALVALLEAMRVPTERRRRWAAELIGPDYPNLRATWHTNATLRSMHVQESAGLVTLLDAANEVQIWNIAEERPRPVGSLSIVAEERLALTDRRLVTEAGADPRLYIHTDHPSLDQLEVVLRAPSGREAELQLGSGTPVSDGLYEFSFTSDAALRTLLADDMKGNWTLSLTDSERGISGELLDWGFGFNGSVYSRNPDYIPQPIPEPRNSQNADARLSPDGRLAISWPADADTRGSILIWDLAGDTVLGRIPREAETLDAGFALNGERVLTLDPRRLAVWDSATGQQLGEIPLTATKLPQLSVNGRYAVINTQRADQKPAFVVWDLQRMQRVGQMITAENAGPVTVDSEGRYLAIGGRDPVVRVWSLSSGTLMREFDHGSPLRTVAFDPSGKWLATDDLSSTFRLWNIEERGLPVIERFGISPWFADFAEDSSSLLFGSSDRVFQVSRLPDGLGAGVRLRHARVNRSVAGPIMLATRNLALTSDASRTVKLWSVPAPQASSAPRSRSFPGGTRAALSQDGQRIAIGTSFGDVRIHAVGAPGGILLGGTTAATDESESEVIDLTFSDDRRLLASATIDGRVKIWDADSGGQRNIQIVHPDGGAHDLAFIDGGRRLVSASRREVIVTDVETGEFSARLRIQANHPQLAVAQETGEIFIADDLNGVTLWNWQADISERIVGGEYRIRTVAVTDDGTSMVTANDDRQLLVWDLLEGKPMEQTVQVAGKVDDMWLTRGDRLIVQAGYWLQLVGVYPTGLSIRNTRMLADAPAAVRPATEMGSAYVLSPSPSRPLVTRMAIAEPAPVLLEGDPDELRAYWRDRLALTLDENGEARPMRDQALLISAADSVSN